MERPYKISGLEPVNPNFEYIPTDINFKFLSLSRKQLILSSIIK